MAKKNVNPKITHKAEHAKHSAPHASEVKAGLKLHAAHDRKPEKPAGLLDTLTQKRWLPWALMAFLLLFVSILYFPTAFQGYTPKNASDISQWQGAANKIIEYNKTHPDNALWTQSMFSGMPSYMISFPNRFPFLENISRVTDKVINWRIFLLFIGALGMFLLLRSLKLDIWTSFFGAVAFMFSCHWLGLVEIGHNTKFRAIMYIPWVIWALTYLRRKPGLLGLGLLATTLIVQLRENHPQISYYLYLFVGMYWVWQLIESIRGKEQKRFWIFTALVILAFGLTLLAVMNPYMSTMEYSHYTMRGGSQGLETSYAQGWSFHPKEIITFFIPDFYGGVSPNYWGYMPFTQVYNYFGLIVIALGIIAILGKKHRRMSVFLTISSFIFLLMSFGSATPWLSDLFLKFLPYFNKFRVPSMILIMVQVIAVILAGLGVDTLLNLGDEQRKRWGKNLFKAFWICGAVFFLWLVLAKTLFGGMSFTSATELAQLAQQNMSELPGDMVANRLSLLYKSGILSLLLLTVSLGLAYLYSLKKLSRAALALLLTGLVFIDLYAYTGKFLKKDNLQAKQEYFDRFEPQDYDEYLLADASNYRILPIDQNILSQAQLPKPTGEWAYHHQIVTGYSAAKLERYDKMLKYLQDSEKGAGEWRDYLIGVFSPPEGQLPREKATNIMDMLSVKYLLHPERLPYDSLLTKIKPVYEGSNSVTIYKNETYLPRAWFVDSVQKVAPADSILPRLRSESFDPRRLAYVETDLKGIQKPDSASVKQTANEMHKLAYDVYTDKPAFLVLSEVYYPAGWKATLDGKEIPIQPANYVLRGLQIPPGSHKLELTFAPDSYKTSVSLSLIGLLASLLALAGGIAYPYLKRKTGAGEQA
jgi:hypothetical protein